MYRIIYIFFVLKEELYNKILMSIIIPGKLYLGSMFDVNNSNFLEKNKINTIICVARNLKIIPEIELYYKVHRYEFEDTEKQDILNYFDDITELIESSEVVLVNCAAGASRSASIVIAYLMKYYQMNLKTAINHVKKYRRQISPNKGFILQLLEYENKLYGNNSIIFTPLKI